MAPLEGGHPNTVGVTILIVFIDVTTLGGRPAVPVVATSLLISTKKTAPGGKRCGPRPSDQFASFLRTDAIGRAPRGPRSYALFCNRHRGPAGIGPRVVGRGGIGPRRNVKLACYRNDAIRMGLCGPQGNDQFANFGRRDAIERGFCGPQRTDAIGRGFGVLAGTTDLLISIERGPRGTHCRAHFSRFRRNDSAAWGPVRNLSGRLIS